MNGLLCFLHESLQHHCLQAVWKKENNTILHLISTIPTGFSVMIKRMLQWKAMSKPLSIIRTDFLPVLLHSQPQHHCSWLSNLRGTRCEVVELHRWQDIHSGNDTWIPHDETSVNLSLPTLTHTQYLGVLGAAHDCTKSWDYGWVFESLFQLGCGLKGDKRDHIE